MKSLLLSFACLFAGTSLFSQSLPVKQPLLLNIGTTAPGVSKNSNPNQSSSVIDTADQYIVRATGGSLYQGADGGYVFGTSLYYDSTQSMYFPVTAESGIEFDAVGSATITDLLFWCAVKYINAPADDITAKIYDVGPDSMPVNELGNATMNMADVDTGLSPIFTMINFPGGVNITGDYFVGINYEGIDDTLGLVSTALGDGMGEKRIRQKASFAFGGLWYRMGDLYNYLDVDLFFAPIYTLLDDGVSDHFTLKNATLDPIYPTVATSEIHLDYKLASASDVSYYIFDIRGGRYFEMKSEKQAAGAYSQTFDVSTLAAGNYFVAVTINGQLITQKAVVTK